MRGWRRISVFGALAFAGALVLPGGADAGRGRAAAAPDFGNAAFVRTFETEGGGGTISYSRRTGSSFDQTIIGDFRGSDGPNGNLDDIVYYTPGPASDRTTLNNGSWGFGQVHTVQVDGDYEPLVGSFADDDGKDDIFWYAPGRARDFLWDFNADGSISQRELDVDGTYRPLVGHFSSGPSDDIIWYAPGRAPDAWWDFDAAGRLVKRPFDVAGTYQPLVGRFAGTRFGPAQDGIDDIFWYAPGRAPDSLWDLNADRSIAKTSLSVNGSYRPVSGNFTGDGYTDILWYGPGQVADTMWDFDGPAGARTSVPMAIGGDYRPLAAEVFSQPDHLTDIVWFAPGAAPDEIWDHVTPSTQKVVPVTLDGNVPPQFGVFYHFDDPSFTDGLGADLIDRIRPTT